MLTARIGFRLVRLCSQTTLRISLQWPIVIRRIKYEKFGAVLVLLLKDGGKGWDELGQCGWATIADFGGLTCLAKAIATRCRSWAGDLVVRKLAND